MGQNQAKPSQQLQHRYSLIKGYYPLNHFTFHHLSNQLQLFQHQHNSQHFIVYNRYHIDSKSPELLYQNNNYYRSRIKTMQHPNILQVYHSDIVDEKGNSVRQQIQQFGNLGVDSQKKVNVNTICSLNIFQQNCQKTMTARESVNQLEMQIYHQYHNHNLECEIEARKKRNQSFTEKQIWEIIGCAAGAGMELVYNDFKEPLLSPLAIKIDTKGNYKVGEWEFSHFFEDQNDDIDEDTNFFEQGQAYVKSITSRVSNKKDASKPFEYNILTSYYWAPEGTSSMQSAVTLGKLKKSNVRVMTEYSRMSTFPKSQIFSLGMTILHMCLMKPLYQSETYSQKKIKSYLQLMVATRKSDKIGLSNQLVWLLDRMLRWDVSQRINYTDLNDEVMNLKTSHTIQSVLTSQPMQLNQDTKITKSFIFAKDVDGSGSINQGHGDIEHPIEQSSNNQDLSLTNRNKNQADYNLDYQKVDFTIRRERKQWQKFQSRLQQSSYKVKPNNMYQQHSRKLFSSTTNFSFPADLLMEDQEDTPTQQNLCRANIKSDNAEKMDQDQENYCCQVGEVGGFSRISDSIKLLDISNIKACLNQSHSKYLNSSNQKHSLLNYNAVFDEEQSLTKTMKNNKSAIINTSDNDSLLLKSSTAPETANIMVLSAQNQQQNIFTSPQLMAMIRSSSIISNSRSQQAKSIIKPNQQKQKQKILISESPSSVNLSDSTFVKQSYAKGYFQGNKIDGLRNGYSTFHYNQGGKYCGDWQNNQMHGKGTLYYSDGSIAYQGDWKCDSLNGKGILYNQKPKKIYDPFDYRNFDQSQECWVYYQGYFYEDDKWGNGTLLLSNGQKYEGSFKNDLIEGKGIFYSKQGLKIYGEWSCNKLVKVIKQVAYSQE